MQQLVAVYRIDIADNQYKFISKEETDEKLQYENLIEIVKEATFSYI